MASRVRSLKNLARDFDLKDWSISFALVGTHSDREAAILATSMVERESKPPSFGRLYHYPSHNLRRFSRVQGRCLRSPPRSRLLTQWAS
jgi:hypothetical protein